MFFSSEFELIIADGVNLVEIVTFVHVSSRVAFVHIPDIDEFIPLDFILLSVCARARNEARHVFPGSLNEEPRAQ